MEKEAGSSQATLSEELSHADDPHQRYARIAGDAEAIKSVRTIEERAEAMKKALAARHKEQKAERVSREITKQAKKKTSPAHQHPAPEGERDARRMSSSKIVRDAEKQVETRMAIEMNRIDRVASDMIEKRIAFSERVRAQLERIEEARNRQRDNNGPTRER